MKKILFSKKAIELAVIFLLGLTPLLWFEGNEVILGHDAGLPLSPLTHFLDRLFSWTYRFGFGVDQSYAMPGFFIHGLEALSTYLGASLQLQQKIEFVFWFTLPGLTMYYFANRIAEQYKLRFFTLPVVTFYMFNHFLLQGWFIAERTKFSLYAALPLVMALLFDWEDKKRGTFLTSIFISFLFFFLNGEGSLPLFGGLIITLFVYFFFYFFSSFTKEKVFELVKLVCLVMIFSLLLHLYWLLPFVYFISHAYSQTVESAGGVNGVIGWLSYISENSSLINLLRLQGIPEWYQNPLHPYASTFLSNYILVFISILIPVMAFAPLRFVQERGLKRYVYFFVVLALFSMIFIGGSHPPFGALYVFLVKVVPGFLAFRTPFYKFSPALWFAYSILLGFTINYFLQVIYKKNKFVSYISYGLVGALIVGYSYPFLNGMFFNYIKGERSMKVEVPQYVYDFRDWSETHERKNMKTLVLPPPSEDMNVDAYRWGYWSLSPLPSLLTNAPVISISSYMSEDEKKLLYTLSYKLKKNDPSWKNLAKILNISSLLVRKDFAWDLKSSSTDDPEQYSNALQKNTDVELTKKFGEWEVYDLKEHKENIVSIYPTLDYLQGGKADITKVVAEPEFNTNAAIYVSGDPASDSNKILNRSENVYIAPHCILCSLVFPYINEDLYIPTLTPDSFLYPIFSVKEKKTEESINSRDKKVDYYIDQSLIDEKGIERVIVEKKSKEAVELSFNKYYETIKKLNKSLTVLVNENNINNNATILKAYNFLRIQRKSIMGKLSDSVSQMDTKSFNDFFLQFDRTYLLAKNNAWYTSTLSDKKYLFDVPKDEVYTLLVRKNTLSDPEAVRQYLNYKIDGKEYKIDGKQEEDGWYTSFPMTLKKGTYKLELQDLPLNNLFAKPENTIIITSKPSKVKCYTSQVFSSEKGEFFRLAFQYQQVKGNGMFFYTVLQAHDIIPLLGDKGASLKKGSSWGSEEYDYVATNNDGIRFVVCNRIEDSTRDEESILQIKNVGLYKITEPEIILRTKNNEEISSTVSRSITRSTNTLLALHSDKTLKNNIVVLNTTFTNEWKSDSPEDKFLVNGYANGWYIQNDLKDITMEYEPQKLVKIGFIISAGAALILFVLIILIKLRKKYEK